MATMSPDDHSAAVAALVRWYDTAARTLPWRSDPDPWGVLVSEVMLQQTPVARVLPAYDAWIRRWPRPADLAADAPGDAVRMWGRLGYPRRALRLHAAAQACVERFEGRRLHAPSLGDGHLARASASPGPAAVATPRRGARVDRVHGARSTGVHGAGAHV
jgi:endonuclease III